MRWICTRNDVLGNLAVLLAAIGVFGTGDRMANHHARRLDRPPTVTARITHRGVAGAIDGFYLPFVLSKNSTSDLIIGSSPNARPGLIVKLNRSEGEGTSSLNASKVTNITKSRPLSLDAPWHCMQLATPSI